MITCSDCKFANLTGMNNYGQVPCMLNPPIMRRSSGQLNFLPVEVMVLPERMGCSGFISVLDTKGSTRKRKPAPPPPKG